MEPIPLPKLLLALFGAAVGWKSYQAYRARRRNPALPQEPVTDRWWRRLFLGVTVIAIDSVAMLVLHNTIGMPEWLLWPLFGVLGAAVLLAFAASFMIGWRGVA